MAINFPRSMCRCSTPGTKLTVLDQEELLDIVGIDAEKVRLYGPRFLKLIQQSHREYESMMRQQEDIPEDPNHRTVVDLLSSDEDDPSYSVEEEQKMSSQEERSSYFPKPAVSQFNEQCKSIGGQPTTFAN